MPGDLPDHVKRLLEIYDGKAKDFQRYFILLVALSLFIMIFILVPFVSTQNSKILVLNQINSTKESINSTRVNVMYYENAKNGIELLHNRLSFGAAILKNYIESIENLTRSSSNSSTTNEQTGLPRGSDIIFFAVCNAYQNGTQEWFECNVDARVRVLIGEYDRILDTNILDPLTNLDNKAKTAIRFGNLTTAIVDLKIRFNKTLAENPKFWNTINGKGGLFALLDSQVNEFWGIYRNKIDKEYSLLTDKIKDSEVLIKNLNATLVRLNNEQDSITKRIDEFQSPIGKLTAGFNNVITVFPFAVAGGFLVCTSILVETILIRKDYFKFHPKTDNGHSLNDDEVARTAPLWLDPKDDKQNKIIRTFVLLLPMIMYFVSISLIFFSWNMPQSSLGIDPYFRPATTILYLSFGSLLFGIAFVYIKKVYSEG